jgi:hypothetical protein
LYIPFFSRLRSRISRRSRSGLFSLFTVVMFSTHFVLISTNQTTLEHFNARTTKDRENEVLNEMHSTWDLRCVSPLLFLPPVMSYCYTHMIGLLFQGEASYTTKVGRRVRPYRARG